MGAEEALRECVYLDKSKAMSKPKALNLWEVSKGPMGNGQHLPHPNQPWKGKARLCPKYEFLKGWTSVCKTQQLQLPLLDLLQLETAHLQRPPMETSQHFPLHCT